jgi:four helix bundle protein
MIQYTYIEVWSKANEMANEANSLTKLFPFIEFFSLTLQIRRISVIVPKKIAEGSKKTSSVETIKFLFGAKNALYKLENQFNIAFNQRYISLFQFNHINEQIVECKKMISNYINSYQINNSNSTNNI